MSKTTTGILQRLITQPELERIFSLASKKETVKGSAISAVFDVIVGNVETAFDDAIKKRIHDQFPRTTELDLEDVQAAANAELGDTFGQDLDLFETGATISPKTAQELRSMWRGPVLTSIDTAACTMYTEEKRPVRTTLLEALRQAMNNHYLAVRDEGRAVDDCNQLFAELQAVCDTYASLFDDYSIDQTELKNEFTRVGRGVAGQKFRDHECNTNVIHLNDVRRGKK